MADEGQEKEKPPAYTEEDAKDRDRVLNASQAQSQAPPPPPPPPPSQQQQTQGQTQKRNETQPPTKKASQSQTDSQSTQPKSKSKSSSASKSQSASERDSYTNEERKQRRPAKSRRNGSTEYYSYEGVDQAPFLPPPIFEQPYTGYTAGAVAGGGARTSYPMAEYMPIQYDYPYPALSRREMLMLQRQQQQEFELRRQQMLQQQQQQGQPPDQCDDCARLSFMACLGICLGQYCAKHS